MDELIEEILEQRNESPDDDFDKGWNEGLSCAIGIIELYFNSTAHENAHGN